MEVAVEPLPSLKSATDLMRMSRSEGVVMVDGLGVVLLVWDSVIFEAGVLGLLFFIVVVDGLLVKGLPNSEGIHRKRL